MDPLFKVFITIVAIVVTLVKGRHIKDKRKRIVVIMAILLLISIFSNRSIYWLLYWDGPFHGQVVDADTGEPIEGAAVAGIWEFESFILFITSLTHFANAGHPAPITISADGQTNEIEIPANPIGLIENPEFEEATFFLTALTASLARVSVAKGPSSLVLGSGKVPDQLSFPLGET